MIEELGRGGMAIVWLARHRELGREVALKELLALQASDPDGVRRFLRESRLAGSLSHPCIVTVYDLIEHDGTPYIAMEYLPRGTLRPWVPTLAPIHVVGILDQVLSGVAHAAKRGIVHRDLKPENLLVTDDGAIKIADFGIAKAIGQAADTKLTATGTAMGTPAYMAPEQAMGTDVSPATDLYSLGVIAYELLARRPPFDPTGTPMAVLLRHIQEPLPPLLVAAPSVDPQLAAWVEALLAKRPEDRPAGADAAREHLEEIAFARFGPRWQRESALAPGPPPAASPPQAPTPAPPPAAAPPTPTPAPPPAAASAAQAPSRRGPRPALLAAIGAAAVVVVVVVLLASGGGSSSPGSGGGARSRTARGPAIATIAVGPKPDGIAVVRGHVYVCLDSTGQLVRLAPRATVAVGPNPDSVVLAAGKLWVTATADNSVVTVNPRSMRRVPPRHVFTHGSPEGIAAGFGSIWVAALGDDFVDRLDQLMTSPNAPYQAAIANVSSPVTFAFTGHDVWVATYHSVTRLDPGTNTVKGVLRIGAAVRGIAATGGQVYAISAADRTIVRIDPATFKVTATLPLPGSPRGLAAGAGALWVTLGDTNRLLRIDPQSLRITRTYPTGRQPLNLAVGARNVWTSNFGDGTVTRVAIG